MVGARATTISVAAKCFTLLQYRVGLESQNKELKDAKKALRVTAELLKFSVETLKIVV